MYYFLPPGFINAINFVIDPCGSYSRFIGAESCVKVCFGFYGSECTNLQSIAY